MAKGVKGSTPAKEAKPVRTSFIIDQNIMKKIRYIALMSERDITDLVHESLQDIISRYEKKNGLIPIK